MNFSGNVSQTLRIFLQMLIHQKSVTARLYLSCTGTMLKDELVAKNVTGFIANVHLSFLSLNCI